MPAALPPPLVGGHRLSVCRFPRAVPHGVSLELMEGPLVVSNFHFITPRAESEVTGSPLGCRWWMKVCSTEISCSQLDAGAALSELCPCRSAGRHNDAQVGPSPAALWLEALKSWMRSNLGTAVVRWWASVSPTRKSSLGFGD